MQTKSRPIELLSPAKDLNCGIEAINHGADAVYIGAPKFGARSAAGNSLDDIHELASMRICMAPASMLRLTRY